MYFVAKEELPMFPELIPTILQIDKPDLGMMDELAEKLKNAQFVSVMSDYCVKRVTKDQKIM